LKLSKTKLHALNKLFLILLTFSIFNSSAQDTSYARKTINKLCAHKYHGRGYYKNGAIKSGTFIASEMKKAGLKTLPNQTNYFQHFSFPVNVFENKMELIINGITLTPGIDFIVNADCPSYEGNFTNSTVLIDNKNLDDSAFRDWCTWSTSIPIDKINFFRVFIIDTIKQELEKKYSKWLSDLKANNNTITFVKNKLTWTVDTKSTNHIRFEVKHNLKFGLIKSLNRVSWKVNSRVKFTSQKNIIGYIPGTEKPDSFIFITAHYDHLGQMGKHAIFRGANDNACGVAMMLDMTIYYAKNPQKFSIVFIAFAGEEAGLIGSGYFVNNPIVPLKNIRFLVNLDLVGTGEEGGTVVNATLLKREFNLLDSLNKMNHYLPILIRRGKAANSDHYYFSEAGVPSFFLYLAGPRPSYHDVKDIPRTITFAGYNGTFRLISAFLKELQ